MSFHISVLMGAVFTKEELTTRSLTGTTSNFQKGVGKQSGKEALDKNVRDAVIGNYLELTLSSYNLIMTRIVILFVYLPSLQII